jgi:regulator of protease activity HflC (stomatin/prohibitin superfamily)
MDEAGVQTPSGWPPKRLKRRLDAAARPSKSAAAVGLLALLVIFGASMAFSGRLGITVVDADEVAVVLNYLTGKEEVIPSPGIKLYLPFVQEVYKLDKTTQDFLMQGPEYVGYNHVPLLTVRAKDGSNFRIDDLRIQYEIIPGEAARILNDSGPGEDFKKDWIRAHARSILRDEFGRYSAVEVANPTIYKQAPSAATDRLNQLLMPHGVRVVLIKTPNPEFDQEYENAIENRKEADQEVERLIAKVEQLKQEREQRLAAVRKEKEVEMQQLQGELIKAQREAEASSIRVQKSADAYATKQNAQGEGLRSQLLAQARGLEARYRKEAEGIASKALALEERGEVVVREALIQKLTDVRFTLIPYSRDPAPVRLEHVDLEEHRTDPSSFSRGDQ